MELSTRSRQRQLQIKDVSERSSRSLSRHRARQDDTDLGLRRSARGKIELMAPLRRGRNGQRLSQSEKIAKRMQKSSSESMSDDSTTGLKRKGLKKGQEKSESQTENTEEIKTEGETHPAIQHADSFSESNEGENGAEDNNESDAKCEETMVLFCRSDNAEKPADEQCQNSAQDGETEAEFSACDNKVFCESTSNNDNEMSPSDEASEGKSLSAKRKRRRRRFNPKKKETSSKSAKEGKDVSRCDNALIEDNEDMDFESSDKDEDYEPTAKRNRGLSIINKLQTSKGFVDKVQFGLKPEEVIPMKRTPRMASLNAIAKVNAVLESYSPLAGRTTSAAKENANSRRLEMESKPRIDKRRKRSTSSVTQTDDISYFPPLKDAKDDWTVSSVSSNDVFSVSPHFHDQPISDSKVSSTSNWNSVDEETVTTKDKAVQTIANHKAVQTDSYLMQDRSSEVMLGNVSNCTCNNPENATDGTPTATTYYKIPPTVPGNTLNVPLRSSILTKTTTHTIAIPFTKTHVLSHVDMGNLENFPSQVSSVQNNKRMASLNAIAMMNAMKVLDKPFLSLTNFNTGSSRRRDVDKTDKNGSGHIRIPKINFQATSTSKFSGSNRSKVVNAAKSLQLKNLSSQIEKLIESKRSDQKPSSKMVNGWLFEGEPLEKPVVYDDKVVIRRYYTSMRRNAEVINVRDAVLLKSGPRKRDLPFVARVAAIWEEEGGYSSGDMMISVFWYYRPEQTEVGKIPGYNGDLEVLASRHRDDNSAACVVDKCYVLSYPQYCRFRARNKLSRESRKVPLSLVPPSESTRPGSMPPANIDPNLVFFCRHAYDSRTGKILKNPFY